MMLMGGKHRQAPGIVATISPHIPPGGLYVEPFMGAMGSASAMARARPDISMVLADVNDALVTYWTALLGGWEPPSVVTEEEYGSYKRNRDPLDPMTAFVGFGCSFGGRWFSTFARDRTGRNFARNARNACIRKAGILGRVAALQILWCDYRDLPRQESAVYYLDPPYANRSEVHGVDFDSGEFWEYTRRLSVTNPCFITEFAAPPDFVGVYSFGDTVVRYHGDAKRVNTCEQIFRHRSQV